MINLAAFLGNQHGAGKVAKTGPALLGTTPIAGTTTTPLASSMGHSTAGGTRVAGAVAKPTPAMSRPGSRTHSTATPGGSLRFATPAGAGSPQTAATPAMPRPPSGTTSGGAYGSAPRFARPGSLPGAGGSPASANGTPTPVVPAAHGTPVVAIQGGGTHFAPPASLPPTVPSPVATPHPAYVAGPLDGLTTPWDVAHQRPLAVMVENLDPDARPQTGLNDASLVFETVTEYGITRFMAVYLEHQPAVVGPVRSARVYYNAWAAGLHTILVHAGGNDDALAELWTLHSVADLNEVAFEGPGYVANVPFFFRSPDRYAPHNLYTYPAAVRQYLATQHVQLSGDYPDALPHRNPSAPFHRPFGGTLDLNFSSPGYAVDYRYDHATNTYLRWMGGAPHVDAVTGAQIAPSNVVVLMASIAPDPYGGVSNPGAVYVQSLGKGLAYYFRDGREYKGTWHKATNGSPLKLFDSAGHPFKFNPGQTWIEVLPTSGSMSWTPGNG